MDLEQNIERKTRKLSLDSQIGSEYGKESWRNIQSLLDLFQNHLDAQMSKYKSELLQAAGITQFLPNQTALIDIFFKIKNSTNVLEQKEFYNQLTCLYPAIGEEKKLFKSLQSVNYKKPEVKIKIKNNKGDLKLIDYENLKTFSSTEWEITSLQISDQGSGFDHQLLGMMASTKNEDKYSIGGYGEGLKMSVLNLLRSFPGTQITIASHNPDNKYILHPVIKSGNLQFEGLIKSVVDQSESGSTTKIDFSKLKTENKTLQKNLEELVSVIDSRKPNSGLNNFILHYNPEINPLENQLIKNLPGNIYVKGMLVNHYSEFIFGWNFTDKKVVSGTDRKNINLQEALIQVQKAIVGIKDYPTLSALLSPLANTSKVYFELKSLTGGLKIPNDFHKAWKEIINKICDLKEKTVIASEDSDSSKISKLRSLGYELFTIKSEYKGFLDFVVQFYPDKFVSISQFDKYVSSSSEETFLDLTLKKATESGNFEDLKAVLSEKINSIAKEFVVKINSYAGKKILNLEKIKNLKINNNRNFDLPDYSNVNNKLEVSTTGIEKILDDSIQSQLDLQLLVLQIIHNSDSINSDVQSGLNILLADVLNVQLDKIKILSLSNKSLLDSLKTRNRQSQFKQTIKQPSDEYEPKLQLPSLDDIENSADSKQITPNIFFRSGSKANYEALQTSDNLKHEFTENSSEATISSPEENQGQREIRSSIDINWGGDNWKNSVRIIIDAIQNHIDADPNKKPEILYIIYNSQGKKIQKVEKTVLESMDKSWKLVGLEIADKGAGYPTQFLTTLGKGDKGKDSIGRYRDGLKRLVINCLRQSINVELRSNDWQAKPKVSPIKVQDYGSNQEKELKIMAYDLVWGEKTEGSLSRFDILPQNFNFTATNQSISEEDSTAVANNLASNLSWDNWISVLDPRFSTEKTFTGLDRYILPESVERIKAGKVSLLPNTKGLYEFGLALPTRENFMFGYNIERRIINTRERDSYDQNKLVEAIREFYKNLTDIEAIKTIIKKILQTAREDKTEYFEHRHSIIFDFFHSSDKTLWIDSYWELFGDRAILSCKPQQRHFGQEESINIAEPSIYLRGVGESRLKELKVEMKKKEKRIHRAVENEVHIAPADLIDLPLRLYHLLADNVYSSLNWLDDIQNSEIEIDPDNYQIILNSYRLILHSYKDNLRKLFENPQIKTWYHESYFSEETLSAKLNNLDQAKIKIMHSEFPTLGALDQVDEKPIIKIKLELLKNKNLLVQTFIHEFTHYLFSMEDYSPEFARGLLIQSKTKDPKYNTE